MPLTIGFDLDMTLLDTRKGIAAAYRELSRRTGVPIDDALVVSRLGPPLRDEMANWFPAGELEDAITLYRSLYPEFAVPPTVALPGAEAAIGAVRAAGGSVIVITSKLGRLAELHLAHLGLVVDAVYGNVFAEEKGVVLRDVGATAMVGDHVADIRGAVFAGIRPVGVASGPCSPEELTAAGADVVLPTLVDFPGWLDLALPSARG